MQPVTAAWGSAARPSQHRGLFPALAHRCHGEVHGHTAWHGGLILGKPHPRQPSRAASPSRAWHRSGLRGLAGTAAKTRAAL